MAGDPIDEAIAASESQRETRVRMDPTLPSGRVAIVDLPTDMTLEDFRAFVGWVAVDMARGMMEAAQGQPAAAPVDITARRRASRLVVPS